MAVRRLPDLTPEQVVRLQDALLANADALLTASLAVLDLGHFALARSLAILGLEESGKAIAVHERRVAMGYALEGETFRCDRLDELWASHQKKLETVHRFLVDEPYWFGTQPADPGENAAHLTTIKTWARGHDRSKQRGFYVDLSKTGEVMAPTDIADEAALRQVIRHVHQIGWQLRLGEHIEGKRQDEKVAGMPAMTDDDLAWFAPDDEADQGTRELHAELRRSMKQGVPGKSLPNAAYRFNPAGADRSPFRNVGKPGYEAETRELMRLSQELGDQNPNEDRPN
jgi:AbiV family abortive infection protein